MPSVPTVQIKDPLKPGDYIVINESGFDPSIHELYDPTSAATAPDPEPEPAPDPVASPEFGSWQAEALAEKHGLKASDIPATGKGGEILIRDVRAVLAAK